MEFLLAHFKPCSFKVFTYRARIAIHTCSHNYACTNAAHRAGCRKHSNRQCGMMKMGMADGCPPFVDNQFCYLNIIYIF